MRQGDVIGYVGSTGLATGPHVCYRFWKNGNPVPEAFRADFIELRDSLYHRLVNIGLMEELAMIPSAAATAHVR